MNNPTVRHAARHDMKIGYTSLGRGPPVLLTVHYGAPWSVLWGQSKHRDFALALADKHRVLYLDLRGEGEPASAPLGDDFLDDVLADMICILDDAEATQVDVVASYLTAPWAVALAARHPNRVRSLLLWAGMLTGRAVVPGRSHMDPRPAIARRQYVGLTGFTGNAKQVQEQLDSMSGAPKGGRVQMPRMVSVDAMGEASRVTCPTLVVAPKDGVWPTTEVVEELAQSISGAGLIRTPGAAVNPSFDDHSVSVPLVLHWLAEVDPDSPPRSAEEREPASVQTILFTDLAGSTAMQLRLGDEGAMEVLRAHDAAVRQAIGEFNGREIKRTGDGTMATFGSAADAVNCALTVRRDIATYNDTHEGEELLVRFGLNAGEPIVDEDDLFGLSVTLAARIGDWGEPGQVLCSNVVRELLLGKGFEFTSVGSAELKGLDEPVPLYEVSA